MLTLFGTDDDYYIRWRLKLKGETESMGVCTKERKGVTAEVLMATPCPYRRMWGAQCSKIRKTDFSFRAI